MAKAQALSVHRLTDGWSFKQADDEAKESWMTVKKVPTNVHLDLIEHGKYVIVELGDHLDSVGLTCRQNTRSILGLQRASGRVGGRQSMDVQGGVAADFGSEGWYILCAGF